MTPAPRTLALVGAGPGLGLAIAKRSGTAGFQVALLARNSDRLGRLVTELAELGVTARRYVADVADRLGLAAALAQVESDFGVFEPQVLGGVTAATAVLPGMRARKNGTLLFITGASSVHPVAMMGKRRHRRRPAQLRARPAPGGRRRRHLRRPRRP